MVWIGLEQAVNPRADDVQDLRVVQAPLAGTARVALSVVEGIVLRMLPAIAASRQQPVAGMDPVIGREDLLRLFQVVPDFIKGIRLQLVVLALPVAECRGKCPALLLDRQFLAGRDKGFASAPIVDVQVLLEKFHGPVDQPLPFTFQRYVPVRHGQPVAIFADRFLRCSLLCGGRAGGQVL